MLLFKTKTFNPTSAIGNRGEKAALDYLKKSGYKILETNFCNTSGRRKGEIDIIAKENEEIVFIEVKTRVVKEASNPISPPEESITKAKLYKLNKTAFYYLNKSKLVDSPYRFDAISILANPSLNSAKLKHIKNIFI